MNSLFIRKARKGNEVFPEIELNAETGICSISGNSYMQDARDFFKPVTDWFKNYTSSGKGDLLLIYNLQNLNTGTSRVLYEILEILKKFKERGAGVKINWNHFENTEIPVDDIIDLTSEFGINIEIITE